MTNHAIRWKCATQQKDNPSNVPKPDPPDLPDAVPDRVQQHVESKFNAILPDQNSDGVSYTAIDGSGTDYIQGVRRFDDAENKDDIVQAVKNNVVADAAWAVIESHVCDHDEPADNKTGCGGWKVEKELGDVPGDLN